jgi:hypothetical protein
MTKGTEDRSERRPTGRRPLRRPRLHPALLATAGGLLTFTAVTGAPEASAALNTGYTGNFSVSATTVAMGTPITVKESAINLTGSQVPFITVGIRRTGFAVASSTPPATGQCRIAGSATCSFLTLAPNQTQQLTLTLLPDAPGTYTLQGWTTQPVAGGGPGFLGQATVTVTP